MEYVLGFYFSKTLEGVALIRKKRPSFLVNKLNGIGGKIEAGETPLEAMKREAFEEAGISLDTAWEFYESKLFGDILGHVFYAVENEHITTIITKTDEEVFMISPSAILNNTLNLVIDGVQIGLNEGVKEFIKDILMKLYVERIGVDGVK